MKNRLSSFRPIFWALPAALALGACVSTGAKVRVQQGDTDLTQCRTFDWLPASQEAASFTEQRVRAAAMEQLQVKGYARSTERPDCRITYVLSTHERPASKPRVGVGGGSRGVGGGIGVSLPIKSKNQHAGTFTLDVVDVARNAQIWSGSLDAVFASNELSAEEAARVVRRILAEFPDRAPGAAPNQ